MAANPVASPRSPVGTGSSSVAISAAPQPQSQPSRSHVDPWWGIDDWQEQISFSWMDPGVSVTAYRWARANIASRVDIVNATSVPVTVAVEHPVMSADATVIPAQASATLPCQRDTFVSLNTSSTG